MRSAALLLCGAVLFMSAGCGSSGDGSSSTDQKTLEGTITSFPEYLDPALSLSLEGASSMWNTYLTLLTYEHKSGRAGTKLIPGLARELPRMSEGGRRFTLYLRKGLRYSDGTPIRASDFRFAVERLLKLNSGFSTFFAPIIGAERFQRTKKGGIPGIQTDDRIGRITIRLDKPSGTFVYVLANLSGALLPPGTPDEDMTAHPPPASGPYEIVASHPGRSWEYARNPEWAKHNAELMPQIPSGHVSRIEFKVNPNQETQIDDIERGDVDWSLNPPPSDRMESLRDRFEGTQLTSYPQISVFYFWMNTKTPPFDDVRVRRAVNYAIDPAALTRIYAGQMAPMQQILPPAMPGHRTFQPYPHDMARAKALIAAADPSDREISVWTNSFPANREAGEYYEGVLRELGFETKLKVINSSNYFTVIGNLSTPNLDTGWGNWLLDYPHPNDYFEPQLTEAGLASTNNTDYSQFNDPGLTAAVEQLGEVKLGPTQEDAYARLDREYMHQAPWAPFGTLTLSTFVSPEVELEKLVVSPVYGTDLTSFVLR